MHSYLHGHPSLIHAVKKLERHSPDQFEIYFEHRTSTKIDSKNQEIDSLSRSEDVGIAIRLVKEKKLGFAFTTSLEKEAIQKAVDTAVEVANFMPEDHSVGFYSLGSSIYPSVDNLDSKGLNLPVSEKASLAIALEAHCRKADKKIKAVRSATLSETCLETHLVDSNGGHVQHTSSGYSASITCKAEHDGDSQMGSEFGFSNYLAQINRSVRRESFI